MSYGNPGVERIGIEQIEQQPRVQPIRPQPPPQEAQQGQNTFQQLVDTRIQQAQRSAIVRGQVLAVLQAVAMLVTARLLLLLAVCAGFYLALLASQTQAIPAIAVLIVWTVLTVLPLIWLDHSVRTPPNPYQGVK